MKIEIDLPDRIRDRQIVIFAGIEMIASKEPGQDFWTLIDEGCTRCGKCCKDQGPDWPFYDEKKGCKYLEYEANEYKCGLQAYRPYGCCCSIKIVDYCGIKTRKVIRAKT